MRIIRRINLRKILLRGESFLVKGMVCNIPHINPIIQPIRVDMTANNKVLRIPVKYVELCWLKMLEMSLES